MGTLSIFVCLVFVAGMIFGAVLVLGRKLSADSAGRPGRGEWRFCVLGAAVCLVISIGSTAYTCFFLSRSRGATATVTGFVERKTGDNETVRSGVCEYEVDGVRYERQAAGSDGRRFSVGDRIPIRYERGRPHESRIDYWGYHWGLAVFMLCAAVVCAGLAVVLRGIEKNSSG
jgi:hypothetical protein